MIDQVAHLEKKIQEEKISANFGNISVNLRFTFLDIISTIHEKTAVALERLEKYIQEYIRTSQECFTDPENLLNKVGDYFREL